MTNYVAKALKTFQHPYPRRSQNAPYQWTRPNYGATKQLETPLYTSPPIPEEFKRRIQKMVGNLPYCACSVDCAMLSDLNSIAKKQLHPTQNTEAEITNSLDYADTNHNTVVIFIDIYMVFHIDSYES